MAAASRDSPSKLKAVSFELELLSRITKIAKEVDSTMNDISQYWNPEEPSSSGSVSSNSDQDDQEQDEYRKQHSSTGRKRDIKAQRKSQISLQTGLWSEWEHKRFVEGLRLYGKSWKLVTEHVGTRDVRLIRSHAQKWRRDLKKYPELYLEDADLLPILEKNLNKRDDKKIHSMAPEKYSDTESAQASAS